MTRLSSEALFAAIDATWPALENHQIGPFLMRVGAGGGKRVSAASLSDAQFSETDIEAVEAAHSSHGQTGLFMIQNEQPTLDEALAARGYKVIDPVVVLVKTLSTSAPSGKIPAATPSADQKDIWQQGGIGAARWAVMDRAVEPKGYFGLKGATGFAAISDGICMAHAIEVAAKARRQGLGRQLMQWIEGWAIEHGATALAVLTVMENKPAKALYKSLGFESVARYHYRIKEA